MQEIMEEIWILTILFYLFIQISSFAVQSRHYKRGLSSGKKAGFTIDIPDHTGEGERGRDLGIALAKTSPHAAQVST